MRQSDYEGAVGPRKTGNNHNLHLFPGAWFTGLKDFHKPQIGIGATGWIAGADRLALEYNRTRGIPFYRVEEYTRISPPRLYYYNLINVPPRVLAPCIMNRGFARETVSLPRARDQVPAIILFTRLSKVQWTAAGKVRDVNIPSAILIACSKPLLQPRHTRPIFRTVTVHSFTSSHSINYTSATPIFFHVHIDDSCITLPRDF